MANNQEDRHMNEHREQLPFTTQDLLNTLVAGQAQLQKDIQALIQQMGNKNFHESFRAQNDNGPRNSKESHGLVLTENEKKMVEWMDQMEKLLMRSRRVEEAMDLHSLSLFPQAGAPPNFKMPTLDNFTYEHCNPWELMKRYWPKCFKIHSPEMPYIGS